MGRNFHGGGATKGTSQTQQHYPDSTINYARYCLYPRLRLPKE